MRLESSRLAFLTMNALQPIARTLDWMDQISKIFSVLLRSGQCTHVALSLAFE